MPPSHSRTYRSESPVRLASSPLVAGPCSAMSLNSPVRSPRAASTIVAAAALSARTRPVNSAARFSSIVMPPLVELPVSQRRAAAVNDPFSRHEQGRSLHESYGWRKVGLVREGGSMPQPMGPQDAETFVGRARELAVLSA